MPESFRVLVKELQSLGLSVEVINEKNEVIQFGKEETTEKLPNAGLQPERARADDQVEACGRVMRR